MSLFTLRTGATAHPEDSVLQIITDLVLSSGVKDLSSTNHFKITEKSGTADMSVDVAAGRMIIYEAANAYPSRNTATVNKAVGANSSGNPRIDSVVAYIDLSASPDTTASNVFKLAVVAGTAAVSPTAPDDTAIGTAIGAANPYSILADVAVANGAATIVNANITDRRVQFKTRHMLNAAELTYASTLNVDVSTYNDRWTTLTGNPTVVFLNAQIDIPFIFRPIQDGTGSRTITWPAAIDWFGGGSAPPLTPTASRKDSFMFIKRTNLRYEGYVMGLDANIS